MALNPFKKKQKSQLQVAGNMAFVVGVLIAFVAGLASGAVAAYAGTVTLVLVVLGFLVGLLNITESETTHFLVAAIALGVAGTANLQVVDTLIPTLGTVLSSVFRNVAVFVAPAALVVALKAVWNLAKT